MTRSGTTKSAMPAVDPLGVFAKAYAVAGAAGGDLRAAYEAADEAQRAFNLAVAGEREAARVAIVDGREHRPDRDARVRDARAAAAAAQARLDEQKAADDARQEAVAIAAAAIVADSGRDALAAAIEQLIEAADTRLQRAIDELAAARRQLATACGLTRRLDGSKGATLVEAAALTVVAGLPSANGDPIPFVEVDGALRALGATAREALEAFANRKPEPVRRVSDLELAQWNLAAGGSFSDSTSEIRERYLERGPRRAELAKDLEELDQGRNRDQRTWRPAA